MFWRLPGSIRALIVTPHRRYSSTVAPSRTSEPLRILFCGSDDFSIASLRALDDANHDEPGLIESIHVLHRPAKPTGRGLKKLREVPIKQVATEELNLPTHAVDTFTGWTPPTPINLIIAVSFGLFVPPRILNLAQYGGLNVHPSLLPDLRGPAPIEHAILKRRPLTGISIQTLHPEHFDKGTILSHAAITIPTQATTPQLHSQLARLGADSLIDVLVSRKFVPPLEEAAWNPGPNAPPIDYAPRLTKQDRYIDLSTCTLADILTVKRALGPPWIVLPNGKRLILLDLQSKFLVDAPEERSGIFFVPGMRYPVVKAKCGGTALVRASTYEGYPVGEGNAKAMPLLESLARGED